MDDVYVELRELIAAECHDQWSRWMKYMVPKLTYGHQDNVVSEQLNEPRTIHPDLLGVHECKWTPEARAHLDRWLRQMETPYAQLSEKERQSDRVEADKIIKLLYDNGYIDIKKPAVCEDSTYCQTSVSYPIRRTGDRAVYSGPHVGTCGPMSPLQHNGPEDFSDGISAADLSWEQDVRSAMMTGVGGVRSFGDRWHGDWESWCDADDQMSALTVLLWGPVYRRLEQMEPPFGRG